ncbi:hypothetical protein DW892_08615 [Collinsella sp. AM40-7AC]|uniref:hypothetical protein n=1 Tax=Collinsella TaxID=102106 RepID=UPI000E4F5D59|nr:MULTISPECIES: hypothetical protein [Collinsella]RHB16659.1 hypothetical protein DW892_08615 [Collinsella sp. AM40-7AC]
MASSDATQRAVLAGLSCGIGLAAPVVMYAATLPFSSVNETVVAGAAPFAVGAVAGVGIYAASLGISEYRAQREERLFQPDAMGGAANLNQHQSEFKTASIPAQQQDAIPYAAASASQAQSEQSTSALLSGLTGAFQRRHVDDGVPTIARAADAMDEAEAWSMIDSMLDDDSPVSCDPARSRDVYQVAIDELTNGGQTGSFNRDDIAAAARAVSGSQAAPAGSTAAFVALVANAAVNNAYSATSADANASADNSYVDEAMTADEEAVAARRAAESSLWGAPAQQQAAEAAPYNANLASMPIISGAAGIDLDDLDEPAAITASIDAQDRIDTGDLPDASLEVDVPMADYSGHEGMWAAATAILDEIDEPAPVSAPAPVAAPQPAAPAYVGRHSAVFPEDTARISRESIERAEAIAAGIMENRRHERVNQILEEEIERLQSSTAKRTGRAYLSVIEGGTASFAPLRAEA